jgi:hypothetical protein
MWKQNVKGRHMVQALVVEQKQASPTWQALKDGGWVSIQDIFAAWDCFGVNSSLPLLMQREHLLGTATLPGASLVLIYCIASQFVDDLSERIWVHQATLSARETQAVLPPGTLVQKTVTVVLGGKLLLWTAFGESRQTLQQRQAVAAALGISKQSARHATINPPSCCSEEVFGMARGMVSPFLPPLRRTGLSAVIQESWPHCQDQNVAVSLSLYESLILPASKLRQLLRCYVTWAYEPQLPWIELEKIMPPHK